jgi:hypothetical protein
MTDFNHGDAYRLRALGVAADPEEMRVITSEEFLRACLNALFNVQRERNEALAAAARWRRLFWLCAAALVAAVTRKWTWWTSW